MQERSTGASSLYYLYGVTDARSGPLPPRVRSIASSGLRALVAEVSRDEFAPETLEAKLHSLDWVADQARAHQATLEHASRSGSVIPARLCTLFSSPEAVRAYLDREGDRLRAILGRVAGCQEWGLKLFCDERLLCARVAACDRDARDLERAQTDASPGKAYVLAKQREARSSALSMAERDAVADEILDALEPLVVDAILRPPLPECAFERAEVMVLNLAALIAIEQLAAVRTTLEDLAGRLRARHGGGCFELELSGPWPPYSFCDEPALGAIQEAEPPGRAEEAR